MNGDALKFSLMALDNMHRGVAGKFRIKKVGGEEFRPFIPFPLPPDPPIEWKGMLPKSLEAATLALGRLDGFYGSMPNPNLLLNSFLRKEALLSSQIEGTQSSLSDLLRFELDGAPGVPLDDVREVASYIKALEFGLQRLREVFPLSNRLLRDTHSVLLAHGGGRNKLPGEFRTTQNWIGGTRPGNAHFVPPPAAELAECMGHLENFLHTADDGIPALVRAGLAHVQFETIHPFPDGNGRLGRLLITLFLHHTGTLRYPLLYLSLYLKQHRSEYYELLDRVRLTGDWEAWLGFFLRGIKETADNAVAAIIRISEQFASDRNRIEQSNFSTPSTLRVHESLTYFPISSISRISQEMRLSFPTVSRAMEHLVDLQIAAEITGKEINRTYAYFDFVSILAEGT